MTGAASNKAMAAALVDSAGSTVQIRTGSTVNEYGERTWTGTPVDWPAHIERVASNPPGFDDEVLVEWRVLIPSTTITVDTNAEITLPAPLSATAADPSGRPTNTTGSANAESSCISVEGRRRREGQMVWR